MSRLLLVAYILLLASVPVRADHCQTPSHVGDATVSTTATVVMPRNTTRCHAMIQNAGSVAARCRGDGGTPTASHGSRVPGGAVLTLDGGEAIPEWSCIAESSSTTITVTEVLP